MTRHRAARSRTGAFPIGQISPASGPPAVKWKRSIVEVHHART